MLNNLQDNKIRYVIHIALTQTDLFLVNVYLVQKETQNFHLMFVGKITACQNHLNSVVSPCNTDLN